MLKTVLFILIGVFGAGSYLVGVYQMVRGRYRPSAFSRVVWVLLAVNSFAGVILSKSTRGSVLLAAIFLLGNLAMCVISFWKGTKTFGRLELVCVGLLIMSGLVWILFKAPLVNLAISLAAHFIGAAPTYKKVWLDPASESTAFWGLFFIASLLSVAVSYPTALRLIIFPLYFAVFDGSLFILSARRKAV